MGPEAEEALDRGTSWAIVETDIVPDRVRRVAVGAAMTDDESLALRLVTVD